MREYDPIDRNPERMVSEPPPMRERESGLTTFGIIAALAIAIGAGMYFFSTSNDRVAMNDTPAVTTGQSTTTPAPAPDAGKTDTQ